MKILDFESFRRNLILEAEGDSPDFPAEPAPAEPAPAPDAPVEPAPAPSPTPAPDISPIDTGSTLPPDPNVPAASTETGSIRLVVIDPDKKWHTKYSDGGGIKRYTEYEITQADLEKWITDSGLTDKANEIRSAASGKQSLSTDLLDKLKKSLNTKSFGKDRGDVDITFDSNGHPSTNDLELIFVKSK